MLPVTAPPGPRPDPWCRRHSGHTSVACTDCQDAAQALIDWRAWSRAFDDEQRAARREAERVAVNRCGMCDERGRAGNGLMCRHDPGQADTYRRGLEMARAAIRGGDDSGDQ